MQEIAYLIVNNGNFEEAKRRTVIERGPFLEMKTPDHDGVAIANSAKRPRQIKTHLQYKFFEKTFKRQKPRVIVVMRNLKVSCKDTYKKPLNLKFSFPN